MCGVRFSDTPALTMGTGLTLKRLGTVCLGPSVKVNDYELLNELYDGKKEYDVFFDIETDTYVFGDAAPGEAFQFIGHLSYEIEEADPTERNERYDHSVLIVPDDSMLEFTSPDLFTPRGFDPLAETIVVVIIPEIRTFLIKAERDIRVL